MVWTPDQIPSQEGRVAMVTGANAGIGFETARALAGRGAHVILACRNHDKGRRALERILEEHDDARVELTILDLSSLASVRACAARVGEEHPAVHLLINNAGIMATPHAVSEDGFEMQLATNHLGPFALTGLLLPSLVAAPAARVITVSSQMHRVGRVDFDDLNGERRYERWTAYSQTKLCNILFARELQRRLKPVHPTVMSVACHPGAVQTQLQARAVDSGSRLFGWAHEAFVGIASQSPEGGALPLLHAATAEDVEPGGYYGPGGPFQLRGAPRRSRPSARARDEATAKRLWEVSQELTGVSYL